MRYGIMARPVHRSLDSGFHRVCPRESRGIAHVIPKATQGD